MIKITQSGTKTSVYHKVDDFPFTVTLLTFPENCAPVKLGLHVFGSQVIRYGRLCSSLEDFALKTIKTFKILSSRGYRPDSLRFVAEKVLHSHKEILHKFGIFSAREIADKCLPLWITKMTANFWGLSLKKQQCMVVLKLNFIGRKKASGVERNW